MINAKTKMSFDELMDRAAGLVIKLKEERKDLMSDHNDKIDRLEADLESKLEESDLVEVDCGIGKIQYINPYNLKLLQLMECFTNKVKVYGADYVYQKLNL